MMTQGLDAKNALLCLLKLLINTSRIITFRSQVSKTDYIIIKENFAKGPSGKHLSVTKAVQPVDPFATILTIW